MIKRPVCQWKLASQCLSAPEDLPDHRVPPKEFQAASKQYITSKTRSLLSIKINVKEEEGGKKSKEGQPDIKQQPNHFFIFWGVFQIWRKQLFLGGGRYLITGDVFERNRLSELNPWAAGGKSAETESSFCSWICYFRRQRVITPQSKCLWVKLSWYSPPWEDCSNPKQQVRFWSDSSPLKQTFFKHPCGG